MKFAIRLPFAAACGLVLTLCLPALSQATTLNVPTQYATIQAAVNAAQNGDMVLIADGTYTGPGNVDIDFGGKNLTVTSQHGPNSTIIDCGASAHGSISPQHRGFYIHSGETSAVISGLTIQNGYTAVTSGVTDSGNGGGICIDNSSASVQNCIITDDAAQYGGGIYNYNNTGSDVTTLASCIITGNEALYMSCQGGGVYNSNTSGGVMTLTSCTISGNSTSGNGSWGGGIYNASPNAYPHINSQGTGAISLTNCVVANNIAHGNGSNGGGAQNDGAATFVNCTVTGNFTDGLGGVSSGLMNSGPLTLTNDILYGNGFTDFAAAATANLISHCDIQNSTVQNGTITSVDDINANPQLFSEADYHLRPGSPCLGAGTGTGAPATTIDGQARPNPPSIGAYEGRIGSAPIPGNDDIFVSTGFSNTPSAIDEYTSAGQYVRTIAVPNKDGSYTSYGMEYLHGIAVNDAGQIVGFNGTRSPELITFLSNTRTFTARTDPDWASEDNGSVGVYQGYSFVLSKYSGDGLPTASIIRFNPDGTSQHFGAVPYYSETYPGLSVGLDGKLYVLRSSAGFFVDVYDPVSLQLLRTVTLQMPPAQGVLSTNFISLAVDASGSIYAVDPYGYVCHFDAGGTLLQSATLPQNGSAADIKIDPTGGRILISVNGIGIAGDTIGNGGVILQTDASLSSFQTLIGLDPNQEESGFIAFGNANLAAALNSTSHVLWSKTDGTLSLWNQNAADGTFTFQNFGPYFGWTATAVADGGTDGQTRLLWDKTDGTASLWSLDSGAGTYTFHNFGPYPGWTAQAISVASDNTTHVLWTSTGGTAALWNYSTATGTFTQNQYGPYPNWTAEAIADGPDGLTRVLWNNADGRIALWNLNSVTAAFRQFSYGPYAGWTANAVSVGTDNTTHILWDNANGQVSLWNQNSDSFGTFSQNTFGPYPGWTAQSIADGADGRLRVLWNNANGQMSLWNLDNVTSQFSQFTYGAYPGWTAGSVSDY